MFSEKKKKKNHFNCHRESKTRKQGAFLLTEKEINSTMKDRACKVCGGGQGGGSPGRIGAGVLRAREAGEKCGKTLLVVDDLLMRYNALRKQEPK